VTMSVEAERLPKENAALGRVRRLQSPCGISVPEMARPGLEPGTPRFSVVLAYPSSFPDLASTFRALRPTGRADRPFRRASLALVVGRVAAASWLGPRTDRAGFAVVSEEMGRRQRRSPRIQGSAQRRGVMRLRMAGSGPHAPCGYGSTGGGDASSGAATSHSRSIPSARVKSVLSPIIASWNSRS
jgi:hypothetical protein